MLNVNVQNTAAGQWTSQIVDGPDLPGRHLAVGVRLRGRRARRTQTAATGTSTSLGACH